MGNRLLFLIGPITDLQWCIILVTSQMVMPLGRGVTISNMMVSLSSHITVPHMVMPLGSNNNLFHIFVQFVFHGCSSTSLANPPSFLGVPQSFQVSGVCPLGTPGVFHPANIWVSLVWPKPISETHEVPCYGWVLLEVIDINDRFPLVAFCFPSQEQPHVFALRHARKGNMNLLIGEVTTVHWTLWHYNHSFLQSGPLGLMHCHSKARLDWK